LAGLGGNNFLTKNISRKLLPAKPAKCLLHCSLSSAVLPYTLVKYLVKTCQFFVMKTFKSSTSKMLYLLHGTSNWAA